MEIVQESTRNEISCRIGIFSKADKAFHWHENFEICCVLNKPCRFRIDGEIIYANPGDIIAIGEQVIHQFLIDIPDTHIRIIQISPKALLNIASTAPQIKTHITTADLNQISGLDRKLNELFSIMEQESNSKTIGENPFLQSISTAIYLLLQRSFPDKPPANPSKSSDRSYFYKITDYINAHFCEDINVNTISKHFFFSRSKLSRIFKKYSGTGINEYIGTLRINKANSLILQGISITEAALSSGFGSIRTFNNVYKNIMNTTPSEYRKR